MVGIYAAVSTHQPHGAMGRRRGADGNQPDRDRAFRPARKRRCVLDIATSVSSFGNIRQHLARGEPLQEGWVVHSKTGEPITDPKKVGEGVLLPIGGHKGSGLALMIGLLAGVLNGAAFGRDVVDPSAPGNEPTNTGQFVVALDVSRFIAPDVFAAEMDRHLNDLRFVADLARLRCDPAAGRGAPQAPRRPQRQRRATAAGADQAARRAGGDELEDRAARGALRLALSLREARLTARTLLFPSTQARTCGSTSGSSASTCAARHAGPDARVIEDVEQVLIVEVEEAHLHVVVEHGPGHGGVVVDRSERLQQLLVDAVVEHEIAGVGDDEHVGMQDARVLVLAEAGQALRLERALDAARPVDPVQRADGVREVAVAHQRDDDLGVVAPAGHGDIEIADARADVGDDRGDLRAAVGLRRGCRHRPGPGRRICGCGRRRRRHGIRRRR